MIPQFLKVSKGRQNILVLIYENTNCEISGTFEKNEFEID